MGCMEGGNEPVSNHPANGNRFCTSRDEDVSYWPALYFQETKISYHNGFWIDYETETFHEIASGFPARTRLIGVIGIDQTRSHLVLLFGTAENKTYSLCTYGNVGLDATYRCVEFIATEPAPPAEDRKGTSPAKVPVPTSGVGFASVDMKLVEARLAWLSSYFSDPFTLIARAGTQVVSTKNGTKPSPFESSSTVCGQCQTTPKPRLTNSVLSLTPQGQPGSAPKGSDPL